MIEIVRVMLAEGLDEGTIHKVLDLIDEEVSQKIYDTRTAREENTNKAKEKFGYNSPEHNEAQDKESRNRKLTHNKIMRDGSMGQQSKEVYDSNGGFFKPKGNKKFIDRALEGGYTMVKDMDGNVRYAKY